jgi:hypothetical protein
MRTKTTNHRTRMPSDTAPALVSFSLWTLAAASFTGWSLALWPTDQRPVNVVATATPGAGDMAGLKADISNVLGRQPEVVAQAPELASRLSLLGVARSGDHQSVALISVDGQAVKQVLRGAEVLPGLLLQSVTLEEAVLGASLKGPAALVLPMPKRPEPVSGQSPMPEQAGGASSSTPAAQPRLPDSSGPPAMPGSLRRSEPAPNPAEPKS